MARIAHGLTSWNGSTPRHHIKHMHANQHVIITSDQRTSAIWCTNHNDILTCQAFIVRRSRSNAALTSYPSTSLNIDVTQPGPIILGIYPSHDDHIKRIWSDGLIETWDMEMERCISTYQLNSSTHSLTPHHIIKNIMNNNIQRAHYISFSIQSNVLHIFNHHFDNIQRLTHASCIVNVCHTNHSLLVLCADGMLHSWPIRSSLILHEPIIDINQSLITRIPTHLYQHINMTSDMYHMITSPDNSMLLLTSPHHITIWHIDKLMMNTSLTIQSSVFSAIWIDKHIVISFIDSSIHMYHLVTSMLQHVHTYSHIPQPHSPYLLLANHANRIVGGNSEGDIIQLSDIKECGIDVSISKLGDSFRLSPSTKISNDPDVTMSALVIDSSSSHPSHTPSTSMSITLVQAHSSSQITFSSMIQSHNRQHIHVVDSPHQIPITILLCYHSWETHLGHSIVVSGTTDGLICVWNSSNATLMKSIQLPSSIMNVHRILNDHSDCDSTNNLLAIACSDGSLRLASLPDLIMLSSLRGHVGRIELVFVPSFLSGNDVVCSLTTEGMLYTWSMIDGSIINLITSPETDRVLPLLLPDHVNHVREICSSAFSSPAISPRNGTAATQTNSENESRVTSPSNSKASLLSSSLPILNISSPPLQSALAVPITPPNRNWSLKQIVKRSSNGWLSKNIDTLLNKPSRPAHTSNVTHDDPARWSAGDERREPLVQFLFSSPELHVSAFSLSIAAWIELIKREYLSIHKNSTSERSEPFVTMVRGLLSTMFADASERIRNMLTASFDCGSQCRSDGSFAYTTHESLVLLTPVSVRVHSATVQAIRAVNATSVLFTLLSVSDPESLPCFAAIEAEIHTTSIDEGHGPSVHMLLYFAFHLDFAISQAALLLLKDRISKLTPSESTSLLTHYSDIINSSLGATTPYVPGRTLSSMSNHSIGSPSSPHSLSTNSFTSLRLRHSDGGDLAVNFPSSTPSVDELMACLFLAQALARAARCEPRVNVTRVVDNDKDRCFDDAYSLRLSMSRVLRNALHSFDPWALPNLDVDVDGTSSSALRVVLELLCMDVLRVFDSDLTPDSEVETCAFDVLSIMNAQNELTHLATKLLSYITCQRPTVVFALLPSAISESGTTMLSLQTKKLCMTTLFQTLRSSFTWDISSIGLTSLLRCARDDVELFSVTRDALLQLVRGLMSRHQQRIHYHESSHRLALIVPTLNIITLYDMNTAERYRVLESPIVAHVLQFAPNGQMLASYHPCSHATTRLLHAPSRDCQVLVWTCQVQLQRNMTTLLKVIDVPDHGSEAKLNWQANDVVQLKQDDISIVLHI